jgi:hypothetical protein
MPNHRFGSKTTAVLIAAALVLSAYACTKTERRVNDAHQEFKRGVKPAANWIDEKSNKAADEGKKAVNKTADAIDGDDAPDDK